MFNPVKSRSVFFLFLFLLCFFVQLQANNLTKGVPGPRGPTGKQGPAGPAGKQGPMGSPGSTGTTAVGAYGSFYFTTPTDMGTEVAYGHNLPLVLQAAENVTITSDMSDGNLITVGVTGMYYITFGVATQGRVVIMPQMPYQPGVIQLYLNNTLPPNFNGTKVDSAVVTCGPQNNPEEGSPNSLFSISTILSLNAGDQLSLVNVIINPSTMPPNGPTTILLNTTTPVTATDMMMMTTYTGPPAPAAYLTLFMISP